ncbi:OsmC family protein [Arenimonas sp.]|uniref:OsmC family protein n=1 Tax=Arenimonas sp. TaxID=1872635 RepID=UPI0039E6F5CF
MTYTALAEALQRVENVLTRRPDLGMHDDAPAQARWRQGTRVESQHANGARMYTDMPSELGGSGEHVTPGWLFRAGVASCFATTIVMVAAKEQIDLSDLEVLVTSRSDTRGLLSMNDEDGAPVYSGPRDVAMQVRIAAANATPTRLRKLVDDCLLVSPMPNAVIGCTPMALDIQVG